METIESIESTEGGIQVLRSGACRFPSYNPKLYPALARQTAVLNAPVDALAEALEAFVKS